MRDSPPDAGFIADLEFLENRDLDLSVRIGGMLAFNALMVTIGTHPISASPGAPLSLDAATQPVLVAATMTGLLPLIIACYLCLRALLYGEEFDTTGFEDNDLGLRQRLFAAFVHSIDAQAKMLSHAVRWTIAGGALTMVVWAWIIANKL
jgi:hypothetical protein